MTAPAIGQMFLDAVFDVIGNDGTFVVPTFSYSFVNGQDFDPANTPSVCGALTEFVRHQDGAFRSHQPDFSVTAIGAKADALTNDMPAHAFGPDSFFARFENANGKFCNFNFDAGSTFVHYVERDIGVPYRYDKTFHGNVVIDGTPTPSHSTWFVHDLSAPSFEAAFEPLHQKAVATGIAKIIPLGRGSVCTVGARDTRRLIEETIQREPFFLTRSQGADQVSGIIPDTHLSDADAVVLTTWHDTPDLSQLDQTLMQLHRMGATSGSDAVIAIIDDLLPVTIHSIPTGTSLGETIIPERWALESATIVSRDGTELLNQNDHPIAVHSRNFSGKISGAELRAHVYKYDYGERIHKGGWAVRVDALQAAIHPDETYQIDIKVKNTFGALGYAIMSNTEPAAQDPVFVDLSQDTKILKDVISKYGTGVSQRTVLFYVQPFDPSAIYEYHLQHIGATLN